jgi:glycosyltransferase involved in cell wall biosynthesis
MSAPKISVLIPVFNGERFLAECLDSVLAQDFDSFEIVISDDCSTDGTGKIIERYAAADGRIRWWRNETNLRQAGNLNLCLRAARGEFIKFVFADDKLLKPFALRRLAGLLQADDSIALATSASWVIDARSELLESRQNFPRSVVWEGGQMMAHCLAVDGNAIGEPSLTMFRRAQAERGFDPRFLQGIDLEMWFHLLEQGRCAFVAEPLAAWRRHEAQQTALTRRTGACADEHLLLLQTYYPRPRLQAFASRQMLFTQIYHLRKFYGSRADALAAKMMDRLKSGWYAVYWLRHKIMRPFQKIEQYLGKRRAG